MGKNIREVEITSELVAAIRARLPKCFLCKWLLEDIESNGKFTGYPIDYNGKPEFPVEGKIAHLELEGFIAKLDASPPTC